MRQTTPEAKHEISITNNVNRSQMTWANSNGSPS